MKFLILSFILLLFTLPCFSNESMPLDDLELLDIQSKVMALALETNKSTAQFSAIVLNKRIGRDAFLASQKDSLYESEISKLLLKINQQEELIAEYSELVSVLEIKIKDLESGEN